MSHYSDILHTFILHLTLCVTCTTTLISFKHLHYILHHVPLLWNLYKFTWHFTLCATCPTTLTSFIHLRYILSFVSHVPLPWHPSYIYSISYPLCHLSYYPDILHTFTVSHSILATYSTVTVFSWRHCSTHLSSWLCRLTPHHTTTTHGTFLSLWALLQPAFNQITWLSADESHSYIEFNKSINRYNSRNTFVGHKFQLISARTIGNIFTEIFCEAIYTKGSIFIG